MNQTVKYSINGIVVCGLLVLCFFSKITWTEVLAGIGILLVPSALSK